MSVISVDKTLHCLYMLAFSTGFVRASDMQREEGWEGLRDGEEKGKRQQPLSSRLVIGGGERSKEREELERGKPCGFSLKRHKHMQGGGEPEKREGKKAASPICQHLLVFSVNTRHQLPDQAG